MALVKCEECGKEISDKSTMCVNCGAPISIEDNMSNDGNNNSNCSKRNSISTIGCLIVFVVGVCIILSNTSIGEQFRLNGTYINKDSGDKIIIKGSNASMIIDGETYKFSSYEKYKESGIDKIDFKYNGEIKTCHYKADHISCYGYSYDKE